MHQWYSNSRRFIPVILLLLFSASLPSLYSQSGNSLRLLYPNGSERLTAGDTVTIRWTGGEFSTFDRYRLEYSTDGGSNWSLIADINDDTSYVWHIPSLVGDNCVVRVTKTRGIAGSGDSILAFRIPWGPPETLTGETQCRYSNDGKKVVCWGGRYISIWDGQTGQLLWWDSTDYYGFYSRINDISFDQNNRRIVVCGNGWTDSAPPHAEVWDVETGERISSIQIPFGDLPVDLIDIIRGSFFPDNPDHVLLTGRFCNGIHDIVQGTIVDSTFYRIFIYYSDLHPDGKQVLFCNSSNRVELRSVDTWEVLHRFDDGKHDVKFSRNGDFAFFVGESVQLISLADYTTRYEILPSRIAQIAGVAESEVQYLRAAMSDDMDLIVTKNLGEAWIWYTGDDRPRFRVTDPAATIDSRHLGLDIHPDGSRVIVPYRSGDVIVRTITPYDDSDAPFSIQDGPASVADLPASGTSAALISRIVPNPARDEVVVYFRQSSGKNIRVRIVDLMGREVGQIVTSGEDSFTLDLSSIPSGSYLIEATTDSGTEVRKLIVDK